MNVDANLDEDGGGGGGSGGGSGGGGGGGEDSAVRGENGQVSYYSVELQGHEDGLCMKRGLWAGGFGVVERAMRMYSEVATRWKIGQTEGCCRCWC